MWDKIKEKFSHYPAQEKVAKLLIQNGLRVKDGEIYCGEIEIPNTRIARSLDVDRRVIKSTIQTIEEDEELKEVFEKLTPISFFRDIADPMGWGVVEIIPEDASKPGILSGVSKIISDAGISIRQAISEDPDFSENATLTIICEQEIPPNLLTNIKKVDGVKKVVIY